MLKKNTACHKKSLNPSPWGGRGRKFKSCHSDQKIRGKCTSFPRIFYFIWLYFTIKPPFFAKACNLQILRKRLDHMFDHNGDHIRKLFLIKQAPQRGFSSISAEFCFLCLLRISLCHQTLLCYANICHC